MFRNVAQHRTLTPGYAVVYPNREKAASKTTKAIVVLIMLVDVALMLLLIIGGWSKLQGLKPVDFVWCAAFLIMAFYIAKRWARGYRTTRNLKAIVYLAAGTLNFKPAM